MQINNLDLSIKDHPTIGEHFVLKVKNTDTKEFIVYNENEESVKIRISLDTALQIAQFIDEHFDEIVKTKMEIGV